MQFGYDIWGNLLSSTLTQGTAPALTAAPDTNNQVIGFCYSAGGNLLDQGSCPTGSNPVHTYTYDVEDRIKSTGGVTYTYDGDGQRIKKTISATTLYWYIGGEILDETDASGNVQDEYVFFAGKRVARRHVVSGQPDSFSYYFADNLGTARVVTDDSGTILDDSDYYPFGGERSYASSSGNHYKFTGKERDPESGLDNFGARYYASPLGRYMTPDPLLNSGRPWNPQTWNRYAYARNNPLAIVDPTGLYDLNNTCAGDDKKCNKQFQQHANDLKKGLENLQKKTDKMKDGTEKTRLENSLKALGTEGDHNGVNVAFGATKDGSAATTDPVFDQSSGKYSGFNVTIDPSKESNGANGYAIDAAHEGTHVSDYENFELNPATSMQPFQIEYRGYQTSAWAAQALGFDNISYRGIQIWNSSWGAVDRQTLQDRGITNVVNDANHPEVQPHNPFPNQ